jgi:hypothetical protein
MDLVLDRFLGRQLEDVTDLTADSDRLSVVPLPGSQPPSRYLVRFQCTSLVLGTGGPIELDGLYDLGIWFPADYLRRINPAQVITWLAPRNIWHPNIGPAPLTAAHPIFVCPGRLTPGTPLVDLLTQIHEILTFNKVTMREDDALNQAACAWSRANQERLPLDRRPLKRTALHVEAVA